MTKEQIDIVFKKKITPDNYVHCQFCINYQMFLKSIAANSSNTITDLSPNCMWFAEHILNGDTKNTDLCPWYIDCRYRIPIQ